MSVTGYPDGPSTRIALKRIALEERGLWYGAQVQLRVIGAVLLRELHTGPNGCERLVVLHLALPDLAHLCVFRIRSLRVLLSGKRRECVVCSRGIRVKLQRCLQCRLCFRFTIQAAEHTA